MNSWNLSQTHLKLHNLKQPVRWRTANERKVNRYSVWKMCKSARYIDPAAALCNLTACLNYWVMLRQINCVQSFQIFLFNIDFIFLSSWSHSLIQPEWSDFYIRIKKGSHSQVKTETVFFPPMFLLHLFIILIPSCLGSSSQVKCSAPWRLTAVKKGGGGFTVDLSHSFNSAAASPSWIHFLFSNMSTAANWLSVPSGGFQNMDWWRDKFFCFFQSNSLWWCENKAGVGVYVRSLSISRCYPWARHWRIH